MPGPYQQLPLEGLHTRVLRVFQNPLGDVVPAGEPIISGRLHTIDLAHEESDFVAVSYTWDNSPVTAHIMLPNGCLLPLNQNLFAVIQAMQRWYQLKEILITDLWIDALCINQNDIDERANQVSMVGEIFSSAACVFAWLGPGTNASHAAFSFMNAIEAAQAQANVEEADPWERMAESDLAVGLQQTLGLLSRSWFHRTWVIQEITLGRQVVFMCGDDAVKLDTFRETIYRIWVKIPLWDLYDTEKDPAMRGLYGVTKLFKIRNEFHRRGAVRLEILLEMAYFVGVTDYRDSVHGFRGICSRDVQKWLPTPDYRVQVDYRASSYQTSVEKVFIETSAAWLCNGDSMNVLALAGAFKPRPPGYPSWAIYIQLHGESSEPFSSGDAAGWHAGGPACIKPERLPLNKMKIQGKMVDRIEDICEPSEAVSDNVKQHKIITAILDLWEKTQCLSRDEHLQLLAYDLVFGLDPDDLEAGPEIVDQFRIYLEWLSENVDRSKAVLNGAKAYNQLTETRTGGWRVFITPKGYLGIGPRAVRKGDIVILAPGCRLPLVLRQSRFPAGTGEEDPGELHYSLISWCYMREFDEGERMYPRRGARRDQHDRCLKGCLVRSQSGYKHPCALLCQFTNENSDSVPTHFWKVE